MKKNILSFVGAGAFFLFALASCNNSSKQQSVATDSAAVETVATTDTVAVPAAVETINAALRTILKDDLDKDLIPAEERKFMYAERDLDGDGVNEYFVAPRGSYFCGSGGCTVFLMRNDGSLITRFTVVDFPFYVLPVKDKGMNRLVMRSAGDYHLMKFDGKTYPANPSVVSAYKEQFDMTDELFNMDHDIPVYEY